MIGKEKETYVVVIQVEPLNQGHYKVVLGDAVGDIYEVTVHEEIMLDYRLVVGKELDEPAFRALEASKDYGKAYSYAVSILARRMYTEKEMRQKLKGHATTEHVIHEVVTKLLKLELLNDEAYARNYIEYQVALGKKSKRRMLSDLYGKGIEATVIDGVMELFDQGSESVLIRSEIEKLYARYSRKDLSDFDLRNKVVQALARKGFEIYEVGQQYDFFIEDLEANAAE